ncbi:DUF1353 domain-containing protein [Caulobacter sp. NIBR1757]|uniref:DUF1353 domain-containing protein n=1 Tax=Caulobacter sp. NIBR1757 TaxID=3016000 RepID=UPI0022F01C20|nr:DUF1353 domain-containing protein [Caulobacter sp. NIBR1757]WGM37667.1 hypothetical protein AMEJIAPC_00566 [Caulobacter sp. NIBR1757]
MDSDQSNSQDVSRDPAVLSALLSVAALDWREAPAPATAEEGPENWGAYDGLPPQVVLLDDGRTCRLLAPLAYRRPDGSHWPVPIGATLDGASIPRAFWSLIGGPFEGRYRNASIVHDRYCDTQERPWKDTHRMFYEAMRCSGVGLAKAKTMYYAVYRFGPRWDAPGQEGVRATTAVLGPVEAAELAADAEAIHVHHLDLDEIDALADARDLLALDRGAEGPAQAALDRARLLVVTGGQGKAEDLEAVAREAALLPPFVMRRFEKKRIRIVACRNGVTDFERSLAGVTPRGWEGTGKTWDDVPGTYLDSRKRVVIATIDDGGLRAVPTRASGLHGSESLTVHECLHGYDYSGGHAVLREDRFADARDADFDRLGSYERQDGRAGLEETFAESGARFVADRDALQTDWPHLFGYWQAGSVESAQTPGPAGGEEASEDRARSLGLAELRPAGEIVLDLRAEGEGGAIGHAQLTIAPGDPAHAALKAHLFAEEGLEGPGGRSVPFRPLTR